MNGKSPVKEENKITVPTPSGPVSVAFPRYAVRPPTCRKSTLIVESQDSRMEMPCELVEDINQIAVKCLDDRKGREIAKALARAAIKQLAIKEGSKAIAEKTTKEEDKKKCEQKEQDIAIVFNFINTAFLEKADTRTWRTLPGEIYMSRLNVKPGKCKVSVRKCGGSPQLVEEFDIRNGETRFVLSDSMYP